jgi:hypothetical protein
MIRKILTFTICMIMAVMANAQRRKLSFGDVSSAKLISTGDIVQDNKITGYYVFVFKELVNKDTSRYGLQIFDENINKIREYGFNDVANVSLLEAASNDSTTAFLFRTNASRQLELKILDAAGNLKLTYVKPYVKGEGARRLISSPLSDNRNQSLFDAGSHGYILALEVKYRRHTVGYEVNYYDTDKEHTWSYKQQPESHREYTATFLAKTDRQIMFNVGSKKLNNYARTLTAFNFDAQNKAFEIRDNNDKYRLIPSFAVPKKGTDTITVMGYYFKGNKNKKSRTGKGIGFYDISTTGQILSKTYNAWNKELSGSLDANRKGKIKGLGYLYLHDMLGGPDGKMFVVAEGYKWVFAPGESIIQVNATDIVLLEFDSKHHLRRTNVYDKKDHALAYATDVRNIHTQGAIAKKRYRFDYEFTTVSEDFKNFAICYRDTRKVSKTEIGSFHIIRFNGLKFRNDDLPLFKDKTRISIYPAKPGTLMIYETTSGSTKMRMEKVS